MKIPFFDISMCAKYTPSLKTRSQTNSCILVRDTTDQRRCLLLRLIRKKKMSWLIKQRSPPWQQEGEPDPMHGLYPLQKDISDKLEEAFQAGKPYYCPDSRRKFDFSTMKQRHRVVRRTCDRLTRYFGRFLRKIEFDPFFLPRNPTKISN